MGVGEGVGFGVHVGFGVGVGLGVHVGFGVGDGVIVGCGVGVGGGVGGGVFVGCDVGVGEGIGVFVGCDVGVGDGSGVVVGFGVGECGGGGGPGGPLDDGLGAGVDPCEPCPPNEQTRKFPIRVCDKHKTTIPASTGQYLCKNVLFFRGGGVGVSAAAGDGEAVGDGACVGGNADGCGLVFTDVPRRRTGGFAFSIERTTETFPQAFGM